MARTYENLTTYLRSHSEPAVELSFTQLDRLVGGLPESARKYPAWWANSHTAQPHARYWLDAGRRAKPDFGTASVRFTFGVESNPNPRKRTARARGVPSLTATGGTVQATIRFEWLDAGQVTIDTSGKPAFPPMPAQPGVYRFKLQDSASDTVSIYIGESDNLGRRMGNYRNPGPTQPTNQRLHARMLDVLDGGGRVQVSVATEVLLDGRALDLTYRPVRLLAENAALVTTDRRALSVENL